MIRIAISFTLVLSTLIVSACGSSQTATSARQGAGTGAAMGALAGLVFGGDIDDVIEGAAVGGAVGAGTGAAYGAGRENQYKQDAYAAKQAAAKRASQKQLTEQQTIALLGTDTWEGYKAARTCQSQRAIGLAQAGRAAANPNHRLAAEYLLADLGLVGELCEADAVRHAYSHFKLELSVFRVEIEKSTSVAEAGEYAWYSEDALKRLPLHGAHKKVYSK